MKKGQRFPMLCTGLSAILLMTICVRPIHGQGNAISLRQALDWARQRAPLILSARARIEEARGRLAGAVVRFRDNPLLEFDAGPRFINQGRILDMNVGVSQNFELGGRRSARIAGAEAGIAEETANSDDATRHLLRDVANAFLRCLWAQERLALLKSSEQLATDLLQTSQKRYDSGDIPILQLNLAKTSAIRANSEVRNATVDLLESLGNLRVFLGMAHDEPLAVQGNIREQSHYDLESLLAAAPERPDLKALAAEIHQAEADVQLGEGFKRPEIAIGGNYLRDERNNIVEGGVKVTLPVFSKGQELQATGTARANRIRGELAAAQRTVRSEIQTALEIQRYKLETADEMEKTGLPALQENENLSRRSYEEGEIGLPELLFIRREILETKLLYADSLLGAALSGVEVEFRAGVLK
jgi:outer membrane protein, heavy metal efflux system